MSKALLALFMAGKLGKFMTTGSTMLLSIFTYTIFYGWWYAVGFLGMIFAHEMGHYIAAKRSNLNVGAPCFIPFVGAWIALKEQPMNAEVEAYVGIAGPVIGSLAAFVCYLLAHEFNSNLLLAISYAGFMLNLFNLIPITPLDGGRIVSVITPRILFFGIPILVSLFLWKPSPLLLMIGIIAIPQAWAALSNKELHTSDYYRSSKETRLSYSINYLMLVVTLSVCAFQVHEQLQGL